MHHPKRASSAAPGGKSQLPSTIVATTSSANSNKKGVPPPVAGALSQKQQLTRKVWSLLDKTQCPTSTELELRQKFRKNAEGANSRAQLMFDEGQSETPFDLTVKYESGWTQKIRTSQGSAYLESQERLRRPSSAALIAASTGGSSGKNKAAIAAQNATSVSSLPDPVLLKELMMEVYHKTLLQSKEESEKEKAAKLGKRRNSHHLLIPNLSRRGSLSSTTGGGLNNSLSLSGTVASAVVALQKSFGRRNSMKSNATSRASTPPSQQSQQPQMSDVLVMEEGGGSASALLVPTPGVSPVRVSDQSVVVEKEKASPSSFQTTADTPGEKPFASSTSVEGGKETSGGSAVVDQSATDTGAATKDEKSSYNQQLLPTPTMEKEATAVQVAEEQRKEKKEEEGEEQPTSNQQLIAAFIKTQTTSFAKKKDSELDGNENHHGEGEEEEPSFIDHPLNATGTSSVGNPLNSTRGSLSGANSSIPDGQFIVHKSERNNNNQLEQQNTTTTPGTNNNSPSKTAAAVFQEAKQLESATQRYRLFMQHLRDMDSVMSKSPGYCNAMRQRAQMEMERIAAHELKISPTTAECRDLTHSVLFQRLQQMQENQLAQLKAINEIQADRRRKNLTSSAVGLHQQYHGGAASSSPSPSSPVAVATKEKEVQSKSSEEKEKGTTDSEATSSPILDPSAVSPGSASTEVQRSVSILAPSGSLGVETIPSQQSEATTDPVSSSVASPLGGRSRRKSNAVVILDHHEQPSASFSPPLIHSKEKPSVEIVVAQQETSSSVVMSPVAAAPDVSQVSYSSPSSSQVLFETSQTEGGGGAAVAPSETPIDEMKSESGAVKKESKKEEKDGGDGDKPTDDDDFPEEEDTDDEEDVDHPLSLRRRPEENIKFITSVEDEDEIDRCIKIALTFRSCETVEQFLSLAKKVRRQEREWRTEARLKEILGEEGAKAGLDEQTHVQTATSRSALRKRYGKVDLQSQQDARQRSDKMNVSAAAQISALLMEAEDTSSDDDDRDATSANATNPSKQFKDTKEAMLKRRLLRTTVRFQSIKHVSIIQLLKKQNEEQHLLTDDERRRKAHEMSKVMRRKPGGGSADGSSGAAGIEEQHLSPTHYQKKHDLKLHHTELMHDLTTMDQEYLRREVTEAVDDAYQHEQERLLLAVRRVGLHSINGGSSSLGSSGGSVGLGKGGGHRHIPVTSDDVDISFGGRRHASVAFRETNTNKAVTAPGSDNSQPDGSVLASANTTASSDASLLTNSVFRQAVQKYTDRKISGNPDVQSLVGDALLSAIGGRSTRSVLVGNDYGFARPRNGNGISGDNEDASSRRMKKQEGGSSSPISRRQEEERRDYGIPTVKWKRSQRTKPATTVPVGSALQVAGKKFVYGEIFRQDTDES